eukprot:1361108-Pyramimonas_sp.AAC.1
MRNWGGGRTHAAAPMLSSQEVGKPAAARASSHMIDSLKPRQDDLVHSARPGVGLLGRFTPLEG